MVISYVKESEERKIISITLGQKPANAAFIDYHAEKSNRDVKRLQIVP